MVLVGICGAFGVLFAMYHQNVPDPHRTGVLYVERCGGSFDGLALTAPLVQLLLSTENIEIRFVGRVITIPYSAVRSVRIERHIVFRGVWIAHDIAALPIEIILFSRRNEHVRNIIAVRSRK